MPTITLSSTGLEFSGGLIQTTKPVFMHPTTVGSSYGGGYYVGSLYALGYSYFLVVASSSAETTSTWGEYGTEINLRRGMDGYNNTENLVNDASSNGRTYGAASYCWNLSHNGYTDWYLPSIHELILLHTAASNLPAGQGLSSGLYWSSNFAGPALQTSNFAHATRLSNNTNSLSNTPLPQTNYVTRNTTAYVRPFRRVAI